jgi:hypothetical protein
MLRALSPSICRNSRVMTVAGRPVQRFLNEVGDSAHPSQRVQPASNVHSVDNGRRSAAPLSNVGIHDRIDNV